MKLISRTDSVSRPAMLLIASRALGFALAFAIPVVLARTFTQAEFGTYKQLFLIYGTLFGLAQLGMAESLYYFVPRKPGHAGGHVSNALLTLALTGTACAVLLYLVRRPIAGWLSNPQLADYLLPLGIFLALMLVAAAFEIVMVSRKRHVQAACTYAASDVIRTAGFVLPALALWGLSGVLAGAIAFAGLRVLAMLASFRREFGKDLRLETSLWRPHLAYALPFALAVGIEVVQMNYHQYAVASRFDAATFAIYAVGCLQIPLVDLIASTASNVMMVKMAEDAHKGETRATAELWHGTISRLALVFFPLFVVLLLTGRNLIVVLFTSTYAASVPIFMLWTLTILPFVFCVDPVLRAYAQTRFLFGMNLLRLTLVALLIGWFMATFGLPGAVLVTVLATSLVKVIGLARIARLMDLGIGDILPWGRLAGIAACAVVAVGPAYVIGREFVMPPLVALMSVGLTYGAAYAILAYSFFLREPRRVAVSFAHPRTSEQ